MNTLENISLYEHLLHADLATVENTKYKVIDESSPHAGKTVIGDTAYNYNEGPDTIVISGHLEGEKSEKFQYNWGRLAFRCSQLKQL